MRTLFDQGGVYCSQLATDLPGSNFRYLFNCTSVSLQVTGMVAGVPYVFNIINFETPGSQFKQGMQPLLFSVKEAETCGRGWVRAAENVTYFTNKYKFRDVSTVQLNGGTCIASSACCSLSQPYYVGHCLLLVTHMYIHIYTHTKVGTSTLHRHTYTQVFAVNIECEL